MAVISIAKKANIEQKFVNGFAKGIMLPGSYPGVEAYKCALKAGCRVDPEAYKDKTQILFFTKGTGYIGTPKKAYNITQEAVFVPLFNTEKFFIQAGSDLEFLEILVTLTDADTKRLGEMHMALPHFRLLSDCDRYEEVFKGPGVLSYSILTFRRLARALMGATIGAGPSFVGEHAHDSLQQWVYGLPAAAFRFRADGEEVEVREGDWVHIPEKAKHSVEAKAGERINYIWFEMIV
jgi:quercetin dioxygenase-like cupin family protein